MMKVAIVGQGYVGQALGVAAKKSGFDVVGIEKDPNRIQELSRIGYSVDSNYEQVSSSQIVVIAVPTPLDINQKPDLSFIEDACNSILPYLQIGTLVINESTSFPGTLRNFIRPILGENFLYAAAPERIDPGNPRWGIQNTPRVVGGLTEKATNLAISFYRRISDSVVRVSTPEVAESAKLLENTFRQVNIAFINEYSRILKTLGIPALETIEAADTKPFGFMKFLPSIGVGGHCIPVDPIYFSFAASKVGESAKFIDLANDLNKKRPIEVARQLNNEFSLIGKKVQVIGISYKTNSSDTRETPVFSLISELRRIGSQVIWHDPLVNNYLGESSEPLQIVDLGIICNPHNEIDFTFWKKNKIHVIDLSTSINSKFKKYF